MTRALAPGSAVVLLAWALFVAATYGPDLGRGFVKDDFTWIRTARAAASQPARFVIPAEPGFYRPIVTATFALDYRLHAVSPRGYGWTNLTLYLGCFAAIAMLATALGSSPWAAVGAAILWGINPHGINMALVWLSGRTALCLTLFSVLAAVAWVRRRFAFAAMLMLFALASKEEAVFLPLILLSWTWIENVDSRWSARQIASAFLPLAAYFAVRSLTPAFNPATAPPFYRFSADPALLSRNVAEYLDRSATLVALAVLVGFAIYRCSPVLDRARRRVLAMLGVWWIGMFAITIWLPVRSSLYAVCPSVATAIAGAMLLDGMREGAPRRSVTFEMILAALIVTAIPVYRLRNAPWVEGARVSARTLAAIQSDAGALPDDGVVLLVDEDGAPSTFHNAFGDLLTEALQTVFERRWIGQIDGVADHAIAEYHLTRGRVVRVRP